jgi:predicted DCC family thiol-disulfide oxidoreductase YuxK
MNTPARPDAQSCTVFYDGSCALCSAEIALYRRQDQAGALQLVDVSHPSQALPEGLSQPQAMARFHVLDAQGRLLSGAEAFVQVWASLPRWRWLAKLARVPGALWVMERGYRGFLPLRPWISKRLAAWQHRRA